MLNPDITQAAFELGSACFSVLNIRAIRASKSIAGVHWLPTAFFGAWGVYNLWFYAAIHLPLAWWAGLAITCTNMVWLGHVAWYLRQDRKPSFAETNAAADEFLAELRKLRSSGDAY